MPEAKHARVAFRLEQDENGYPPVSWETLWADEIAPTLYRLDNIPFYAQGVSPGDVVQVETNEVGLTFQKVVVPSGISVFRIYASSEAEVQGAREDFRKLGCESELSDLPKLFAFEVPANVPFGPVALLLTLGSESGRWEYEEASLRHPLPTVDAGAA